MKSAPASSTKPTATEVSPQATVVRGTGTRRAWIAKWAAESASGTTIVHARVRQTTSATTTASTRVRLELLTESVIGT